MIVLYIILMVLILGASTKTALYMTPTKRLDRSLSLPSRNLMREYSAIPAESRPFPDLASILKALDEKTDEYAEDREKHFTTKQRMSSSGYIYKFDWTAGYCAHTNNNRGTCAYGDYYRLHRAFEDVKESVREKERALRDSRLKGSLDMIDELETRLREEVKLNNSFVDEFKQLS